MKRRFHRKNKKISRTEGGSLLYVIFFVTLLSILSCGYMAASKYHIRAALKNRAYMEARLTARMIHNSFCEAVRMGESEALGLLMDEFENDSSDLEADEENDDIDEENGIDEESAIDKENDIDEDLEESAEELTTQAEPELPISASKKGPFWYLIRTGFVITVAIGIIGILIGIILLFIMKRRKKEEKDHF